jgi:hypothetical protein
MKLQYEPPPYFLPPNLRTDISLQGTRYGPVARRMSHAKSRPRGWPSSPIVATVNQKPLIANRNFFAWTSHNWKGLLTSYQRLEWQALAITAQIRNYKGVIKYYNGFQLYKHFETAWKTYWYTITLPFDPINSVPDTDAYTPWSPPLEPHNIATYDLTDASVSIFFDSTPNLIQPSFGASIAYQRNPDTAPLTRHFVTINAAASEFSPYIGHYNGIVDWSGVLRKPLRPGLYYIRIWILRPLHPFTPSRWAQFSLDII